MDYLLVGHTSRKVSKYCRIFRVYFEVSTTFLPAFCIRVTPLLMKFNSEIIESYSSSNLSTQKITNTSKALQTMMC